MVNTEARARLRTSLGQLVDGQLTNDEFDEIYWELMNSTDVAVAQIATFGWSLYSSDLCWSYRLTGSNAVDETTRWRAGRCYVFLDTDVEYCWPRFVDHTGRWLLIHLIAGCIAAPGYLLGLMALILAAVQASYVGWSALWVLLAAALLLAWGVSITWLACRYERRKRERDWQEYCRAGDWEAWPFLSQEEYEAAVACRA